jgi:hypothetical protein
MAKPVAARAIGKMSLRIQSFQKRKFGFYVQKIEISLSQDQCLASSSLKNTNLLRFDGLSFVNLIESLI